jgi:hypothetical protein
MVKKTDLKVLINLHIYSALEYDKLVFGMLFVYMYGCAPE